MNKKQKAINIIKLCYLFGILIFIIGFPLLMCFSSKNFITTAFIISISYVLVIIVLYLVLHIIRVKTYNYECPKCRNIFTINMLKDITSFNAGSDKKVLTCPNCGTKEVMQQKLK